MSVKEIGRHEKLSCKMERKLLALMRVVFMRAKGVKGTQRGKSGTFVVVLVVVLLITANAVPVHAVLFESTGDPSYNTNAPSGTLTNSGWQYEGIWDTSYGLFGHDYPAGDFLGTPIAPQFFISAAHIFGTTNNVFIFNGVTYHPIAQYTTFNSDLSIWQVAETFPYYAPLYTSSDETNKPVVVFGRGTDRGMPVVVGGLTNGWTWGTTNWVERWGQSDVSTVTDLGTGVGELLQCDFIGGAGSNECALTYGDSGGGLFIQTNGVWELAGVNYSADGPFSATADGSNAFSASMIDARGFYEEIGPGNWVLQSPTNAAPIPSAFYSTRISANLDWIESVINFNPGPDLQVAGVQLDGNDAQVSFDTGSNRVYYVQSAGSPGGPWSTIISNIPGTGGTVTVNDTNAVASAPRFYRIGLSQ